MMRQLSGSPIALVASIVLATGVVLVVLCAFSLGLRYLDHGGPIDLGSRFALAGAIVVLGLGVVFNVQVRRRRANGDPVAARRREGR